jgi:hypothetical protein
MPWRANFFHVAAARQRHLVLLIHEHGSQCLETRCDESYILTIVDPNDGTGGSQEHAEAAVYREIAFEKSTSRYHPEAKCVYITLFIS